MILILGKENILEYIKNLRNQIRKEQNFHTGDEISKETFSDLYQQYGTELNERVFARYVLDIPYTVLDNIKSDKQKNTKIFMKEKNVSEDINQLRKKIINENHLHINDEIDYERFMYLYNFCEHKLDIYTFASKILDIGYTNLKQLRNNSNKKCKVLRRTRFNNTQIIQLRRILVEKENLISGKQVTYEELLYIYKKYEGILNENDFMRQVLEIPRHTHNRAKKNHKKPITLKYSEILYLEEDLRKIRLEIAEQYNLHVDDEISYTKFREVYEVYKGKFTESRFALEIFGIRQETWERLRSNNVKTKIFIQENLLEEEILQLRDKIILEENLHCGDLISKDKFKELYNKYAGILSEKQFAEEILEMPLSAFSNISKNDISILKGEELDLETILNITYKVMEDYNLKIRDRISYEDFLEIFHKYGGNMSQMQFAEDILDISSKVAFTSTSNMMIMSSTVIPEDFILSLRKKIIEENKIYVNGSITKEEFEQIYSTYNHFMAKKDFAKEVLDINNSSFYNLLNGNIKTCTVFGNELLYYEMYKKLREKIIKEYKLHIRDFIDYQQFLEIYRKYGSSLREKEFALIILDICEQNLNNIKYIKNAKTKVLTNEKILPEEEEIEELRKFFKQYEGEILDYRKFQELHMQYGGRIDEFTFCEQILGFKLNFIKYYKARATIKDPIAKRKAIEIRKKFSNISCRFFSKEEILKICNQYDITIDDFIKYVFLHYNFKFYSETLEAYEHNGGLWFGGKKIPLSEEFMKKHAEKLMKMAEIAVNKQVALKKFSKEYVKDIKSEILFEAIERYGELEKNYGYDYEEICKRIYLRMRSNAKGKISSLYKVLKKDVSEKYYLKRRESADIQLDKAIESENIEEKAISNIFMESDEFLDKVTLALHKLSEMNFSFEEIGEKLTDFLAIEKIELIKLLKNMGKPDKGKENNYQNILQISRKIVEEYKKNGIDIDYEKVELTFYISKYLGTKNNCSDIIEGILFSSELYTNDFEHWEQVKIQLHERKINAATIAFLSEIYNQNKKARQCLEQDMNREKIH